jgi:hypothetical protein
VRNNSKRALRVGDFAKALIVFMGAFAFAGRVPRAAGIFPDRADAGLQRVLAGAARIRFSGRSS